MEEGALEGGAMGGGGWVNEHVSEVGGGCTLGDERKKEAFLRNAHLEGSPNFDSCLLCVRTIEIRVRKAIGSNRGGTCGRNG